LGRPVAEKAFCDRRRRRRRRRCGATNGI